MDNIDICSWCEERIGESTDDGDFMCEVCAERALIEPEMLRRQRYTIQANKIKHLFPGELNE